MRSPCLIVLAVLTSAWQTVAAQTNPAAHYAHGQVWVVWTANSAVVSGNATYAIYRAPAPFADVSQATLVGRLFFDECTGHALRGVVNAAYGSLLIPSFKIPTAGGGTYTLQTGEGVFADTVRASGSAYYAVVPFGQTTVSPNEITSSAVSYTFALNDRPRPHLQIQTNATSGHPTSVFAIWTDGDQNENSGRPDFPVMANWAKRGAAHTFLVVEPVGGLPGSGPWPAVVALHGGDGRSTAWLPNDTRAKSVDTDPTDGVLIAFDDDLFMAPGDSNTTGHFGYAREFDPFSPDLLPAGSRIINYTQRRYIWALEWLVAHANVDGERITLMGHSNGAQGSNMLARVFPERFANVQLFNCSMSLFDGFFELLYGSVADNFETSIFGPDGQRVRMPQVAVYDGNITTVRDRPFTRAYAGKCDDNNERQWRPGMLSQVRWADAQRVGQHFYWDLRDHGMSQWRDYWVNATSAATLTTQTRRDDVANQSRYRRDRSYPAFSNVQAYAGHGDPGPGYIGANQLPSPCGIARDENGDPVANGDDHGTWAGYFDWDTTSIIDTASFWQGRVFLVGPASGYAAVDEAPHTQLTGDIAIRRPQRFHLAPGGGFLWKVRTSDLATMLQTGVGTADSAGVVVLTGVTVPRDPNRVVVQVIPVPPLSITRLNQTEFQLTAFLPSGFLFQLRRSNNLTSWSNLGAAIPGNDASVSVTRAFGTSPDFYQLRISPQ